MKLSFTTTVLLLLSSTVTPLSVPRSDLALRYADIINLPREAPDLEKRRGGGGSGSGGSSGGRSGGGGTRGSSSSSTSSTSSTRGSSNVGGATHSGSGPTRSYARGSYYGGGAAVPYQSGKQSPLGIAPFFLPAAGLAFFPGVWYHGANIYPYNHPYHYVNETSHNNETLPVICLCEQYVECGCDDNNNSTYYESLFGGTQPKNTSIVRVAEVNGTETIVINGTLPNGTTVADPSISSASALSASALTLIQTSGYWVMATLVFGAVWAL